MNKITVDAFVRNTDGSMLMLCTINTRSHHIKLDENLATVLQSDDLHTKEQLALSFIKSLTLPTNI